MYRTLVRYSNEYKRLEAVAKMLEVFSKNERRYWVADCYLDFGSDWMWTTILSESDWNDYQVLTPREWKEIMLAETPTELAKIVEEIRNGDYFND